MTRIILLFICLFSLGLQAEIFLYRRWLQRPFFGVVEDPLVFFGLGAIEALILVVWIVHAHHEANQAIDHQRSIEEASESAQSARLPYERGRAFERLINAPMDRAKIIVGLLNRFGRPFLIVAVGFVLVAGALASLAVGRQ